MKYSYPSFILFSCLLLNYNVFASEEDEPIVYKVEEGVVLINQHLKTLVSNYSEDLRDQKFGQFAQLKFPIQTVEVAGRKYTIDVFTLKEDTIAIALLSSAIGAGRVVRIRASAHTEAAQIRKVESRDGTILVPAEVTHVYLPEWNPVPQGSLLEPD